MFQELMPLLAQRILLLTLSRVSDEQISVNIIPKPLKSDPQDDGSALTTPLRVTGTPKELDEQLPPQLRTAETIVWWCPPCERTMFFRDHGCDPALKDMNGKLYPHPPLLFKACGSHLWVRALAKDERPTAEAKLCMAPYWNCYDNGVCCTGSMRIPQEKSVAAIDLWEESFFQSEFTHASGVRK
ncbi:MAG: PRTRC system protein E, partial [Candidatus Sulfotelmatobacter sp.]